MGLASRRRGPAALGHLQGDGHCDRHHGGGRQPAGGGPQPRMRPARAAQRFEQGVELGKLQVFEGVREYPVRVKCATLPWHTMRAAVANRSDPVTTE